MKQIQRDQLNFDGMDKLGTDKGLQLGLFTGQPVHQHITEITEAVNEAVKAKKLDTQYEKNKYTKES